MSLWMRAQLLDHDLRAYKGQSSLGSSIISINVLSPLP